MSATPALDLSLAPDLGIDPFPILLPRPLLYPASRIAQAERGRLFPSSPGIFRWLEPKFVPGRATHLRGPPALVSGFLSFLLAAIAAAEGTVSVRDGANRFAPYTIAALGRLWKVSADELLDRIRIARAFTAHQMVTLLETWADDEVGEAVPADLLVAADPSALLEQEEVLDYERAALRPYLARRLGQFARALHRPLLLVRYGPDDGIPWEEHGLPTGATLRLVPHGPGSVRVEAGATEESLELVALAPHQRHLEAYETDPAAYGGIERWDGPSLPTATP
ncbi:MAG: hypothetical protein L3J93_01975 [Thermoplasmata archaeon]|nr:hypothetical protein [Thermoplasmata archaeon]